MTACFSRGWEKAEKKLLFVLTRSPLQASLTQSTVRLIDRPETALTGNAKFKRAGEGPGGQPGGAVVPASEVGAPAGRAEPHEVGGCVRKNAPIVARWVLIFVFNPFSPST